MFILYCVVFSTLVHLISFIVSISVLLDNILCVFIYNQIHPQSKENDMLHKKTLIKH